MVVSDQEFWVRSLDSTLGAYGFDVLDAPTGEAAVAGIVATHPDVLIIQAHLRDVSGFELCASLRANGIIDASTPVLIITSQPCSREQRVAALRAGAWECYSFPPDPELLILKLRNYAFPKRTGAPLPEEGAPDGARTLTPPSPEVS